MLKILDKSLGREERIFVNLPSEVDRIAILQLVSKSVPNAVVDMVSSQAEIWVIPFKAKT